MAKNGLNKWFKAKRMGRHWKIKRWDGFMLQSKCGRSKQKADAKRK